MPQATIHITNMIDFEHVEPSRQRLLAGSKARRLAFLGRLNADIQLASRRCEIYLIEAGKSSPDVDIMSMAAEAAIIAYGRCIQGADGRFPQELFDQLSDEIRALHGWVVTLRDKYVGHSVNALNQTVAIAEFHDARDRPSVFVTNARVVLDEDAIGDIRYLIDEVGEVLSQCMVSLAADIEDDISNGYDNIVTENVPQFDLVARASFDFLASRGSLTGKFGVPVRHPAGVETGGGTN